MNTPATDLTAARDDLRFIREVLDRTAPSFRPLAPSFFRAGLVWLLFALLRFSVSGLDLLAYLWPSLSALQLFGDARPFLENLFQRGLLLFCLVLCLLWQREKRALVKLPRLLLSVWQVALLPGAASGQSLLVFSALVALVKDFLPPIALLLTALLSGPQTFRALQDLTGATPGNLGKQMELLEAEGYVQSQKAFVGRRPSTTYRLLPFGREQFTQYVALLASILDQAPPEP